MGLQAGVDRSDLRVRFFQDPRLVTRIKVLCLLDLTEIEIAEAHLFVTLCLFRWAINPQ